MKSLSESEIEALKKYWRQACGYEPEPSWMEWAGAVCIVLFCVILMIAGGA